MVEKRNKIIVAVEDADVNFRRDEFYALLTWVLNSPAYNDQMDEFLLVAQPNLSIPACSCYLTQYPRTSESCCSL